MSQFEFFMAIASVVIAFGLGELARFWGSMIQRANRGRVGVVRLLWTVFLLLLGVQYWIGMWAYAEVPFTHFRDVFALVLPTVLFVLVCHAMTGEMEDDEPDEDVYYRTNRRVIFLALAAFVFSSNIADMALLGWDVWGLEQWGIVGGLCAIFLIASAVEHRRAHLLLALGMVLFITAINFTMPLSRLAGAM